LDDAELVHAALAGDTGALADLVARHRAMVLALSTRLLGSAMLAADVVQEATVSALIGLERLRSPERFGAWYAGIALNIGRRWLKGVTTMALPDELPDGKPGPDEQVESAEMAGRVREVVKVLAAGQQEAVLAFYWQGLTHAEAAAELGVSPGAVKARLHQARAALKPQLSSWFATDMEVQTMTTTEQTWVEMEVAEVRRAGGDDAGHRLHAIVLKERDGTRNLPIYVGSPEAVALALTLEAEEMPRPMTYQLAASLVAASGARVTEVRINRFAESTFYAVVVVQGATGATQVDARPSDALNLALICQAPVYVDAEVLDDPNAAAHNAWEAFPTRQSELVSEIQERRQKMWEIVQEGQTDKPS
jgi:hypothetical protein